MKSISTINFRDNRDTKTNKMAYKHAYMSSNSFPETQFVFLPDPLLFTAGVAAYTNEKIFGHFIG